MKVRLPRRTTEKPRNRRDSHRDRRRSKSRQRLLRRTQMILVLHFLAKGNSTDHKVTQNLDSKSHSPTLIKLTRVSMARPSLFAEDFIDQEPLEATCSL